jgi:hypothetical protein
MTHSVHLHQNSRKIQAKIKEKREDESHRNRTKIHAPVVASHDPTVAQPPLLQKWHLHRPKTALHIRVGSHSVHLSLSLSLWWISLSHSLNVSHGLLWVEEERRKGEAERRCSVRGRGREEKEERREEWTSGGKGKKKQGRG